MDTPIYQGAHFRVLRNGRVRLPDWAIELMVILMIFTPNSWSENTHRLKTIPIFRPTFDVYSLVYAFCVAMDSRNKVMLEFALYDEATGLYRVAPHIASMYDGEPSPLDFWATPQGQRLRSVAAQIQSSARLIFGRYEEFLAHYRLVKHFCNLVDVSRYDSHSTVDWIVIREGEDAVHMSLDLLISFNAYSDAEGAGNADDNGHGDAAQQNNGGVPVCSLIQDLHRIASSPARAAGMNLTGGGGLVTSIYEPERVLALEPTVSESLARIADVKDLMDVWTYPYPSAVGEPCHICFEKMAVPSEAESAAQEAGSEVPEIPVRTPCGHLFGKECLSLWLNKNASCPMCRRILLPMAEREFIVSPWLPFQEGYTDVESDDSDAELEDDRSDDDLSDDGLSDDDQSDDDDQSEYSPSEDDLSDNEADDNIIVLQFTPDHVV